MSDAEMAATLRVGSSTVYRTKQRFVEHGLERASSEEPRPGGKRDLILTLLSPTLTIAMLGAIESLLSAVVADRMSGTRHDSNVELFAQGVANMCHRWLVACRQLVRLLEPRPTCGQRPGRRSRA